MSACANCGKPVDPVFRPFCSKRCADIDLQRWLSGRYVIPGSDEEDLDAGSPTGLDDGDG